MNEIEHIPRDPELLDDGMIRLWGGGPACPGCGGPTHAVTGDEDAQRPWWCSECEVRLDADGNYGSAATFPAGSAPESENDA